MEISITVGEYLKRLKSCKGEYRRPCNQRISNSGTEPDDLYIFFEKFDTTLAIKEAPYSSAGIGCRVFPASLILSHVLNEDVVRNRKVLEIGSGLGVTGLMASKLGAKRVVLSDNNIQLLQHLRSSCLKNCKNAFESRYLGVKRLDWSDFHQEVRDKTNDFNFNCGNQFLQLKNERFDLVLGADILYEPNFVMQISNVLRSHLKKVKLINRNIFRNVASKKSAVI